MNPQWIQSFRNDLIWQRIETTAFHEAGHVVIAKCLNMPILGAEIGPKDDTDGRTYVFLKGSARREWRKRGLFLIAGVKAEVIAVSNGKTRLQFQVNPRGSFGDISALHKLRIGLKRKVWLNRRCEALLVENWACVHAIACALMEKATLGSDDILRICKETEQAMLATSRN